MPSDTREYSWCPFQSREHPTFPADVSNQLHTSLLFPHISKRSQITKWFSGVKVSLWRLSKTFYLTTHCDSQSSFISPPPCPNTHTHTHTLPLPSLLNSGEFLQGNFCSFPNDTDPIRPDKNSDKFPSRRTTTSE